MTASIHTMPVIALVGNPNVGKSTVFNALTNLHQHTGNWPGKTVATARGVYTYHGRTYTLVDLPGTYSLHPGSAEEEVTRDYLVSGEADVTLVVVDATCLERNLGLVLQVLEVSWPVVVCVNLLDEAEKKHISIDLPALANLLGCPVVGSAARSGQSGFAGFCYVNPQRQGADQYSHQYHYNYNPGDDQGTNFSTQIFKHCNIPPF